MGIPNEDGVARGGNGGAGTGQDPAGVITNGHLAYTVSALAEVDVHTSVHL